MKKKYHGEKMSGGVAGLPDKVVMKAYPKAQYGAKKGYSDTLEGIDMLAKKNAAKMNKGSK